MGDFNAEVSDKYLENFCENYSLKSLISTPTCYKNPERPTCIDLCLTDSPINFQSSCVIETGLSDFHLINKSTFRKFQPKVISYRNYKSFSNEHFLSELVSELSQENFSDNDVANFLNIGVDLFNKHAPSKKKFIRGNQSPFMKQEIWSNLPGQM